MRLELLRAPGRGVKRPLSVLFLHGICCSAEIWRPTYLKLVSQAGYDAYALSFRGHGRSEGRGALAWTTLSDYAKDLESALGQIEGPVAIVGHSMGGAVLQEHLRRGGRPAAAVLMNSPPPYGLAAASMRLFFNSPGAWGSLAMANAFGFGVVDPERVRNVLAGPNVTPEAFRWLLSLTGDESPLVGFELQGWRPFAPEPWRIEDLPPMLVMGGAEDRLAPLGDLIATANYYGTEAVAMNGMGHVPMIEPDWQRGVDPVLSFLSGVATTVRKAA